MGKLEEADFLQKKKILVLLTVLCKSNFSVGQTSCMTLLEALFDLRADKCDLVTAQFDFYLVALRKLFWLTTRFTILGFVYVCNIEQLVWET